MNKMTAISIVRGTIHLESGLHIGGGTEAIEIGGIDNPVIKDPRTGEPYIPGSSLKGKMRCLLELRDGKISERNGACNCGECHICRVFGNTAKNSELGITRTVFRDAFLTTGSRQILMDKGLPATEVKTETMIDRLQGKAANGSLRMSERVIAGLDFDFEIALRIFEGDENIAVKLVKEGLALIQKDALGGSGSRGYGRVRFFNLTIDKTPFELA